MLTLEAAQKEFEPTGVYVNTATIGLPPRRSVEALHEAIETWRTGRAEAAGYDELVERARRRFAGMVSVTPDRVAIANQVSTITGLIAAALPDGARVLAAEEDFTSVLFPFLAHARRGVRVQTVPLDRLVEAIRPGVDLVAVSAVQSADGRIVPGGLDGLASAAAAHGCLTYVDATQAVGWLPVDAGRFDFVSCAAYKWLLSPRGTAFGVVRPERLPMLPPLNAGWYAGEDRGPRSTDLPCGWPGTRAGSTSRPRGSPGRGRCPPSTCWTRWGSPRSIDTIWASRTRSARGSACPRATRPSSPYRPGTPWSA